MKGSKEIIKILLLHGANRCLLDGQKRTPGRIAIANNFFELANFMEKFDVENKSSSWVIRFSSLFGQSVSGDNNNNDANTEFAILATPTVYPGTNEKVILSVSGNQIVNNHGDVITLKGFARPSLEWAKQGEHLSVNDILNMMKWGVNTIRLSLNQQFWFDSEPVTQKGSYKQVINAIIHEANLYGLAVILDLHWIVKGQAPMANKESILFWQEVAAYYADFGTVIFELYNEPVNIDKHVWLNGNEIYEGYQQLYDAVRVTGAKNICIVNGLDWGYDLSFVNEGFQLKGYNIVYGSHPYNADKADIQKMEKNFSGILDKYPIIFTEFGVNDLGYFPNGYQKIYDQILEMCEKHNIHYTAWAWWVENVQAKLNKFPCIISDWKGTPVNGGVQIKDDLTIRPATPIYGCTTNVSVNLSRS